MDYFEKSAGRQPKIFAGNGFICGDNARCCRIMDDILLAGNFSCKVFDYNTLIITKSKEVDSVVDVLKKHMLPGEKAEIEETEIILYEGKPFEYRYSATLLSITS